MTRVSRSTQAAARLGLVLFCGITAGYAWLASSTFALLQFLQPRVFPWVGSFSDWHPTLSWLALALLGIVVWPERRRPVTAWLVWPLFLVCGLGAVWNTIDPILPRLTDGAGSILAGMLAFVPLVGCAAVDHLAARRLLSHCNVDHGEASHRAFEARLFVVAVAAALFITAVYAVLASALMAGAFEPDLLTAGLALGLAWSLLDHLWIACLAFVALAVIARLARRLVAPYALTFVFFAGALGLAFHRLVGDALGMQGPAGRLAAATFGVAAVGAWSGQRLRRLADDGAEIASALDAFFGTPHPARAGKAALLPIAAAAALAVAGIAIVRLADWDFVLLKGGVIVVWIATFAALYRVTPAGIRVPAPVIFAVCLAPVIVQQFLQASADQSRVLARYEIYNPSFRLTRGLLHDLPTTPSFDRFLRANTNLAGALPATNVDFVTPLGPSPLAAPPPVFLFVVDSLRPDYLGAYNRRVRFTPRLDAFAAESVVFRHAFTRFGGTGLSLPAIWAGSVLPHKQYVLPFSPMNALEKLLTANGYRQLLDVDSIMAQLLPKSGQVQVLDPGVAPANHEWCHTLEQLTADLRDFDPAAPVFGYALPQDIHMSRLPRRVETGPEYHGFHAPYATKVHAVDGCFGRFIDALKAQGLYDRSLIVVTADHGEMLGEDGRFGHSTHLFPQVIQVPLIVHLPAGVEHGAAIDVDDVALTTDITPTVYEALGYAPGHASPLEGHSLLDVREATAAARRRDPVVIASSYGPVYAALRHNGRSLYIADGIAERDLAYERDAGGSWREVKVTRAARSINQFIIRQHIDGVRRAFHAPDGP